MDAYPYRLALLKMLVAFAALAQSACGGGEGSDGPVGPTDTAIAAIVITDGDGQTATVGSELARPMVVRVFNAGGAPIQGAVVAFRVTAGGGSVFAGTATSDAGGQARERWTLGVTASQAQRLEARAVGANGAALTATFSAVAVAGPAVRLVATSGTNQSALQAQTLAAAVVIAAQDVHANGVAGVQVSLAVNGGGDVTPASAQSDAAGEVRATWTLGTPIGTQRLTATAPGLPALEVQASATQAPPGAPARIVVSLGNGQTVMQHAILAQPLEAWVTDALGNGVPGVTVTFTPVAGGPYFRTGTAVTSNPAGDAGGYARWTGYFHTAGTQLVEARVSPDVKVTFTVNVTPSTHRFDGVYDCNFMYVNSSSNVPIGMVVEDGIVSGGIYNDFLHTLSTVPVDEDSGAYSSTFRLSLDYRWMVTGDFSVDAEGRAGASGSFIETGFGQPTGRTGTWSCSRQ